jgi:AcrR family transcriptional regulator
VLEEAAKALNSRGVSQTSLSEIARRVGVSRAALYYYFEDQEDLVFQSYRRTCEAMARSLDDAVRAGEGAMSVLEAFVDGVLGGDETELAALGEAAYLKPERRRFISDLYEAILIRLAKVLEEGAKRGEVRPCTAPVVA